MPIDLRHQYTSGNIDVLSDLLLSPRAHEKIMNTCRALLVIILRLKIQNKPSTFAISNGLKIWEIPSKVTGNKIE